MSAVTEMPAATQTQTGTQRMTYREALRMAMREEMQRDERVFLMGEEVGVFEGAYKVSAGLLAEFGNPAGKIDNCIRRATSSSF